MKNLITNLWNQLYGANLERFAASHRSAGDIELYTKFEIWLMGAFAILMIAAVIDRVFASQEIKIRQRKEAIRRAECDKRNTQMRLEMEMLFGVSEKPVEFTEEVQAIEEHERVSALAPVGFFEEFYRVAPELAPFPQN